MGKEFEAKFLEIDVSKVRNKLKEMGGKLVHPNIRYVRSVYYRCGILKSKISSYARVRDEGNGVTITVKIFNDPDYPDEYEIHSSEDFDTTRQLMLALNLREKAFQETYREKWAMPSIKGVHEIVFDTIPGLPPYMEIDCTDKDTLFRMIDELKLDQTKMRFGAFDRVYEEYYGIPRDVINLRTKSLTFKNIHNEIKPKKNKSLLLKLHKEYEHLGKSEGRGQSLVKGSHTLKKTQKTQKKK
jgi:adenylate cyclase class 2